ncbi:MAG: PIN domain-containing protein [Candidatus Thermoplasmatota archaeon]|nr:PIN domain-containing protein [Candidatus Thermoplasmatota archaeon]
MNIVIDSNVLFSALIKNSFTRKMILLYTGTFLFPSFIFDEMQNHKQELVEKSGMEQKHFELLLAILLKKVHIVPIDVLYPYTKQAYETVKDIDPDDTLFIACALAYPESILWSDDKRLKQQTVVPIINTTEMYHLFSGEV